MDVKFLVTDNAGKEDVTIANGQLLAISDVDEFYYDMGNERHLVSGVRLVTTLPSEGQDGLIYIIISADGRATLSVWDSTNEVFITAAGQQLTTITKTAYKALPASKKTDNFIYFVTDATSIADLS